MTKNKQSVTSTIDDSFDFLIQIWMRFVIAFSSLIVFFLAPIDSPLPHEFTRMLLISYCVYSAFYVFIYDMNLFSDIKSLRATHWIDTIFFACLTALSGGIDSIYFFFFFFPIIVASVSWGFSEGLKVTFASVPLFTIAGLAFVYRDAELAEAIMRPIYLLVFGYMISYWGGARVTLKQRLGLLHEINADWNPRLGVNHAIMNNLQRMVDFFECGHAILVLKRTDVSPKFVMHTTNQRKKSGSEMPQSIADTTARELLTLPSDLAISYESPSTNRFGSFNNFIAFDTKTLEPVEGYRRESEILSSLFDDEPFLTVPYSQPGVASGRIYLVSCKGPFNRSDVAFAKQISSTMSSVVENMQLVENLISDAGGQERHRISLDVHDTTIQPYIGLTLALDALSREFTTDEKLTARIVEIIDMANMTIQDLRSFKDTLREKSLMRGDFLISAIRRQADRLLRFYSIQVAVEGTVDPNLSGRIAEAAFQIIKEGLSNILRHTTAKKAFVNIHSDTTHLLLEIGNETDMTIPQIQFKPQSIYERVLSLNGEMQIESSTEEHDGYTVIRITIPLTNE